MMRSVITARRKQASETERSVMKSVENQPKSPMRSVVEEVDRTLDALELCVRNPRTFYPEFSVGSVYLLGLSLSASSTQQSRVSEMSTSTVGSKVPLQRHKSAETPERIRAYLRQNDAYQSHKLSIDPAEVREYCRFLTTDEKISRFLRNDYCRMKADKYLLAMVFVYFKRAKLPNYNRSDFFKLLYLAHDTEEEDEEYKYEIFPWAIEGDWVRLFPQFLQERIELWRRMNFRSHVCKSTLTKVMECNSADPIWQRDRPHYHGGAIRPWNRPIEDTLSPRGPDFTPITCKLCTSLLSEKEIPTRLKRRMIDMKPHGPPKKVVRRLTTVSETQSHDSGILDDIVEMEYSPIL